MKHPHDTYNWLPKGRSFKSTEYSCGKHQETTILQDIKTREFYCPSCNKKPFQVIDRNGNVVSQ